MKWSELTNLAKSSQQVVIKDSDRDQIHVDAVKKVLGLDTSSVVNGFTFEVSLFGLLSECSLAAQLQVDRDQLKTIVESGKAEDGAAALANKVYSEDLLNLFDKEDENAPNLNLLVEFIRSNKATFQDLPTETSKIWIRRFSDVNSWSFYWYEQGKLNCLAKMSG